MDLNTLSDIIAERRSSPHHCQLDIPKDRLIGDPIANGVYRVLLGRFNVPSFKPTVQFNLDTDIMKAEMDKLLNNPIGEIDQSAITRRLKTIDDVRFVDPNSVAGTLVGYEAINDRDGLAIWGDVWLNQKAIELVHAAPFYFSVRSISLQRMVSGMTMFNITDIIAFDLELGISY
jgi:hypothetical protein